MTKRDILIIWLLLSAFLFSIMLPLNIWADRINFRGRFRYDTSDVETTNKSTGETTSSDFSQFNQLYKLDFLKNIYPNLFFSGGTSYELNNSKSTFQGTETKSEDEILRPFVSLNLNSPIFKGSAEYRRIQAENKTTGLQATQDIRDEIITGLGWKPAGLPPLNIRYIYTHTYDDPETVNLIDQSLSFDTKYEIWKNLNIDYVYSRTSEENRLKNSETLAQNHVGRINYGNNFFNRHLSLSTNYRIRYNTFEFPDTESVESPLLRNEGLFSLDDTPDDGPALGSNPALINGNVTASAGIDIGLAGDENTFTNIGLDFGFSVKVDKIYIWVDRPLSPSVANSFSWSIYTSPDNTDDSTWTLQTTVSPGSFGTFDNRFEISFAEVNTRFIKVVTTPLSSSVSGAGFYPNIFVTEMQAFITESGVEVDNKLTSTDQNYDLNLIARLTQKTTVGYSLFYNLREQDPTSQENSLLSNSVYASHTFNRIFSANTSYTTTDRKTNEVKEVFNDFAASLRAAYLRTLRQTLTYSRTDSKEVIGPSSRNSIVLHTDAELYKGWSAFLNAGYNWEEHPEEEITGKSIRFGTNIIPNEKVTVNVNYTLNQSQSSDDEIGDSTSTLWDMQAFFIPFASLSFNARARLYYQENLETTLYNYSANWNPFHDGALQFFFTYSETLRPSEDRKSRTVGPALKWRLSRHFLLDMSYNVNDSETSLQKNESNNFSSNLKIIF